MYREQISIEGLHVEIRPAWREKVEREMAHLESQHPGVFTRVAVRFTPVKPHHPGMRVSIDGRVAGEAFNVEREGSDVVGTLHEAFALVLRALRDAAKHSHHVDVSAPSEMAAAEADLEAEAPQDTPTE